MGESAENLGPDNTEVAQATVRDLSEDTVEDITEQMHAEACHDSLTTNVEAIRDEAECV